MQHLEIARQLETHRAAIAEATAAHAMNDPFWLQRFGDDIRVRLNLDMDRNLAILIQSIRYRSPMIFEDHTRWRRDQILGFGCSGGHLRTLYMYMWHEITQKMPEYWHAEIVGYIQEALDSIAYPNPSAQALAAAQNVLIEAVGAVSFDQHWHWQAAYGPEGRPQFLYDLWYLVAYMVDALGASKPDLVAAYLPVLRQFMLARGLSTAHLQQLLWMLTQAMEQHLAPGPAEVASRLLFNASTSLNYEDETCAMLLNAQQGIMHAVAERLIAAGLAPNSPETMMEVSWYMAYIIDSLGNRSVEPLVGYTRWMQQWLASQGLPDTPLQQSYAALSETLSQAMPEYAAREVLGLLQIMQRMVSSEVTV
ncbi:MAG: hypothetical protein EI684_05780 [Candidatus Viridilinea halotolerans]|uniref:Uncharacterized protein n=1 Tax=Candidatus Viridilinea halotolerans TaxID=2491704 RepID=A0A426U506_9CHLR|nr:MAG: hypothetical protein EI684_05780 [Candidatus Viridilinea halotolerans]